MHARTSSSGEAVQVTQTLRGIGDAILGLTAVCAVARARPEARLSYAVPRHAWPWLALFEPCCALAEPVEEADVRDHRLAPTLAVEKQARGGGLSRAGRYAAACGVPGPRRPAVRPLPPSPNPGCVVLCPSTAGWPRREWLAPNWAALEDGLLQADLDVVVLTHEPERFETLRSPKVRGAPAHVASLMNEARLVVGGDTGLMHLCGAVGAPGLVLCGPFLGGLVYDVWPSVRTLDGKLPCRGCYEQDLGPACAQTCAALNQISPQEILATILRQAPPGQPASPRACDVLAAGQERDPRTGEVLPWFTPGALAEIAEWDLTGKRVLEWGGGASSFWWAGAAAHVVTVEADPGWARWLGDETRRRGLDNMEIVLPGMGEDLSSYPRPPQDLKPDIVVIDGARRLDCLRAALELPRPLTVIFDNWQQDDAFISPEAVALMAPHPGVSYPDLHPHHPRHPWQTAIWHLQAWRA